MKKEKKVKKKAMKKKKQKKQKIKRKKVWSFVMNKIKFVFLACRMIFAS